MRFLLGVGLLFNVFMSVIIVSVRKYCFLKMVVTFCQINSFGLYVAAWLTLDERFVTTVTKVISDVPEENEQD
eukprot:UN26103